MRNGGFADDIGMPELLFVGSALTLAGIHLFVASLEPTDSAQFYAIASVFFLCALVRLTPLWRPVLYLLAIGFALFLAALWLLGGVDQFRIGAVTGSIATVFIALSAFLLVRDESRTPPD